MSFGSGDSPQNTQFQTTYQRDAPQIEAAKLGLMEAAKQYTMFGMSPFEAVDPQAKPGEEGYGEYKYTGTDGRYDEGTLFSDLTREQRMREGQVDIPTQGVAAFDPMQDRAFSLADQGIGGFQPFIDQSLALTGLATQEYDPMSYQDFMNPFEDEVAAGVRRQFEQARNKAAAGAGSAFGTEREGIQRAELDTQEALALGQLRAQNYGQAQQMAQQRFDNQMGRYGAAAQQVAGLGGQQQQQALTDIGSLMSAGSVQQQRQQQLTDAQYQQQLQQIYEPYQRLGFTSDIYQGNIPSGAMAISMGTAPGSNPLAQTVGAGISGLAAYQGYQNLRN